MKSILQGPLTRKPFIHHEIKVKEHKPFKIPPYRYSVEKKRAINDMVKQMLADGVMTAAPSPYSSPIVLVDKHDGTYQFCVDFRRINSVTEDAGQPNPVIHEVLKEIGGTLNFTTIDLRKCYWQIPLTEDSKQYDLDIFYNTLAIN